MIKKTVEIKKIVIPSKVLAERWGNIYLDSEYGLWNTSHTVYPNKDEINDALIKIHTKECGLIYEKRERHELSEIDSEESFIEYYDHNFLIGENSFNRMSSKNGIYKQIKNLETDIERDTKHANETKDTPIYHWFSVEYEPSPLKRYFLERVNSHTKEIIQLKRCLDHPKKKIFNKSEVHTWYLDVWFYERDIA